MTFDRIVLKALYLHSPIFNTTHRDYQIVMNLALSLMNARSLPLTQAYK